MAESSGTPPFLFAGGLLLTQAIVAKERALCLRDNILFAHERLAIGRVEPAQVTRLDQPLMGDDRLGEGDHRQIRVRLNLE